MVPAIATQALRHHHQRIGSRPHPGVFHQGQHPSAKAGNRDVLKGRVKNTHANINVCNLGDNAAHPNALVPIFAPNLELQMAKPSIQK